MMSGVALAPSGSTNQVNEATIEQQPSVFPRPTLCATWPEALQNNLNSTGSKLSLSPTPPPTPLCVHLVDLRCLFLSPFPSLTGALPFPFPLPDPAAEEDLLDFFEDPEDEDSPEAGAMAALPVPGSLLPYPPQHKKQKPMISRKYI